MSSNALGSFEEAMEYVEQLIDIHSQVQTGKGRRHRKEAIHRAGVVLIVAAWQAYIEKLTLEVLGFVERILNEPENPSWVKASFSFRKPAVTKSVGDLNTPNSENVRRLLLWSFGFDPRPHGIYEEGPRQWSANEFCQRTDEWLRIRHAIAHGNNLPDNLPWLKNEAGTPRLKLTLLRECERHFRKLAVLTDKAISEFMFNDYHLRLGWYDE